MSESSDNLIPYLIRFGLTTDEAKIYLLLFTNQALTALKIYREIGISRTKVYRLLDNLITKGLVRQRLGSRGLSFEAVSGKKLELILSQKEQELINLKQLIPDLSKELEKLSVQAKAGSKVLYYTGIEGLKQVQWNSTKAENELLIYEINNMGVFIDKDYCEEVRQVLVENKIRTREITNQKILTEWTKVVKLVENFWEVRYIDPKKLRIQFEVMIYNNAYVMYSYTGKDIFCVEIYNQNLASMQKQLFNFVWQKAKQMEIISSKGAAELKC